MLRRPGVFPAGETPGVRVIPGARAGAGVVLQPAEKEEGRCGTRGGVSESRRR